jgi:hypothetical protein
VGKEASSSVASLEQRRTLLIGTVTVIKCVPAVLDILALTNQPITQPTNQPTKQPTNQIKINQPINQQPAKQLTYELTNNQPTP